ncbi:MAG: VIT1/CCC1 transporter family protein [Patescibacteria group bacterium]
MVRRSYLTSDAVRNFVFGVEDSLVSTVGFVSGIATSDVATETILLSGIILILVEAFSMAAGSLLSDNSADEFARKGVLKLSKSLFGAGVMFFSYIISGVLVIAPYMFWEHAVALPLSIGISLCALVLLGTVSARVSGVSVVSKSITMVVVGGIAVAIGIIIGNIASGIL